MPDTLTTALDHLRTKRRQLFDTFLEGRDTDLTTRHTEILDDYFRSCFEGSRIGPGLGLVRNPYAIIAVGGYGRGEQCIKSDIDLLFLFERRIPEGADGLIREIVYPLWDAGYDVGHATRSLKECIDLAANDVEVFTTILDARLICGVSQLYMAMTGRLREKVLGRKPARMIDRLVAGNQARHRRFGDSTYLLEPNLKEGQGGLRDYHTMLWIARIKSDLKQPRDLEYSGYLSHDEFQSLS